MRKGGIVALAGTAAGVGAGLVAQRSIVRRRRRSDPAGGELFGKRRGERSGFVERPDGARIFFEETGPESPRGVVFIHGSAMRTDMWHYQLAGIGDHRLIFYDLRGHGLSQPKGKDEYSIQLLADDLGAVIETAGLREFVLVGHSVGGMVAMQLCCSRPDLVGSAIKGVVLANTTHRPAFETTIGGAALSRLERLMRRPLDVVGTQHHRIESLRKIIRPSDQIFLAVSLAAFGPNASAKQIDFTYDMLADTPADVIFDLFKCYRAFDVTDALDSITIPALVISGTHDRLTVKHASDHLAENLPKAELHLFDGCGHMSMLERHQDFNTMLERFFDDVLGRAEVESGR